MKELIQEFKVWNMAWMTWNIGSGKQPLSIEDFIKKLEKKYKVTKI